MAVDEKRQQRIALLLQAVGADMSRFQQTFERWGIDMGELGGAASADPKKAVEELAELLDQDTPVPIVAVVDDDVDRAPDGEMSLVREPLPSPVVLLPAWKRAIGGFLVDASRLPPLVDFDQPHQWYYQDGEYLDSGLVDVRRLTWVVGGNLILLDGAVREKS